MKRLLLMTSMLALLVPDVAAAYQAQPQDRRPPGHPTLTRPPGHPTQTRPPQGRPPQARPPGHPTLTRPQRPPARPPVVRPLPPHRPGQGRPPGFRPIHRPGFVFPRGFGPRRWRIGLTLPSVFMANRFFFNDFAMMRVGPPPPGHVWVRYGPDLLLVRRSTRRIVDVIYDAFI